MWRRIMQLSILLQSHCFNNKVKGDKKVKITYKGNEYYMNKTGGCTLHGKIRLMNDDMSTLLQIGDGWYLKDTKKIELF